MVGTPSLDGCRRAIIASHDPAETPFLRLDPLWLTPTARAVLTLLPEDDVKAL